MSDKALELYIRPEFESGELGAATDVDVERELSLWEKFSNINAVRKFSILLGLVALWQFYTWYSNVEPLLFPSFFLSLETLWKTILSGEMFEKIGITIYVLLIGVCRGVGLCGTLLDLRGLDPDRQRFPQHHDGDVPAAAGDLAFAAGDAVVWPRHSGIGFRHHSFRPLGGLAQHPCGFHERQRDVADGRAELRPERAYRTS